MPPTDAFTNFDNVVRVLERARRHFWAAVPFALLAFLMLGLGGIDWLALFAFFTNAGIVGLEMYYAILFARMARYGFYDRRVFPRIKNLHAKYIPVMVRLPQWRRLFACRSRRDLEDLEQELLEIIEIEAKQWAKYYAELEWEEECIVLDAELQLAFDELALPQERREQILLRWNETRSPKRRRNFLKHLPQQIAYERFTAANASGTLPAPRVNQVPTTPRAFDRVQALQDSAALVESKEARELFQMALLATSEREKVRLFGAALSAERKVKKQRIESESQPLPSREQAEMRFITLHAVVREKFTIASAGLARTASPLMAREIILALLEPGRNGSRFKAAYRAEDTLRKMVRRQVDIYLDQQFDPREFEAALAWLHDTKVLVSKTKTDERVYSLSSRVKDATTPEAQKIVQDVLALSHSLRNLEV